MMNQTFYTIWFLIIFIRIFCLKFLILAIFNFISYIKTLCLRSSNYVIHEYIYIINHNKNHNNHITIVTKVPSLLRKDIAWREVARSSRLLRRTMTMRFCKLTTRQQPNLQPQITASIFERRRPVWSDITFEFTNGYRVGLALGLRKVFTTTIISHLSVIIAICSVTETRKIQRQTRKTVVSFEQSRARIKMTGTRSPFAVTIIEKQIIKRLESRPQRQNSRGIELRVEHIGFFLRLFYPFEVEIGLVFETFP